LLVEIPHVIPKGPFQLAVRLRMMHRRVDQTDGQSPATCASRQSWCVWWYGYRSYQEAYLDSLGPLAEVVIFLRASIAKMEREKMRERTLA